jgi:hypothetical protein
LLKSLAGKNASDPLCSVFICCNIINIIITTAIVIIITFITQGSSWHPLSIDGDNIVFLPQS